MNRPGKIVINANTKNFLNFNWVQNIIVVSKMQNVIIEMKPFLGGGN